MKKSITTLTYILSALMALPLLGQAGVLCIGTDGHVDFSSMPNDECCEGRDTTLNVLVSTVSLPGATDCDECTDFLLGSGVRAYRASRLVSALLVIDTPALAASPYLPEITRSPIVCPDKRSAWVKTPLSHFRTVSLVV